MGQLIETQDAYKQHRVKDFVVPAHLARRYRLPPQDYPIIEWAVPASRNELKITRLGLRQENVIYEYPVWVRVDQDSATHYIRNQPVTLIRLEPAHLVELG